MRWLWIIGLLCLPTGLWGQSSFQAGLLPEINLSTGLPAGYSLNVNLESRQSLSSGAFGSPADRGYDYILTDASLIVARRAGLANKVALGYLLRFRNQQVHQRLIQQFTLVGQWRQLRTGHRLGADQTFVPDQPVTWRLRYRLALEIPLSGDAVDPGEYYLKTNLEWLHIFRGDQYSTEGRLGPFLGYSFTDRNKVETGLDYRQATLFKPGSRHSFWWSLNWYIKV
jgi:hypothetical protein